LVERTGFENRRGSYLRGFESPTLCHNQLNPLFTDFLELLTNKFTVFETFLKQETIKNDYLEYNKKYLVKINNTYYFSFRYKKRTIKYSFKTNNLYFANILKIQLIERLKKMNEFKNSFDLDTLIQNEKIEIDNNNQEINNYQTRDDKFHKMNITSSISKEEDPLIISKIEKKILQMLIKEKEKGNIKELNFNNESIINISLKDGFEEFLTYKKDENISPASLKSYKTFFKYLLLFSDENELIYSFNNSYFKEIHNDIKKLPQKVFITHKNKKSYKILNDVENKEYLKLSNKYINTMFGFFNNLFKYFVYKNYIVENPVNVLVLKEKTTIKLPFDLFELEVLMRRNTAKDSDIVDYMKMGIYTGMRISEIVELEKDNIDFNKNIINITKSKTESGIRIIPIHKNILEIIKERYKNNDKFLFSNDGNVNQKTKQIGKSIRLFVKDKSKTFHSTRKNFTQKLYELQQQDLIQENTIQRLLGHSNTNISFNVYNLNKINLDVLKNAIDLIEY